MAYPSACSRSSEHQSIASEGMAKAESAQKDSHINPRPIGKRPISVLTDAESMRAYSLFPSRMLGNDSPHTLSHPAHDQMFSVFTHTGETRRRLLTSTVPALSPVALTDHMTAMAIASSNSATMARIGPEVDTDYDSFIDSFENFGENECGPDGGNDFDRF
jgi:hypothetical protein